MRWSIADVGDQLHVDGCQLGSRAEAEHHAEHRAEGTSPLLDIAADVDIAMSDAGFRFNISGASLVSCARRCW